MSKKRLPLRWFFRNFLTVVLAILLVSCDFLPQGPICDVLDDADFTEVTEQVPPRVVFEEPGTIIAVHGFSCAEQRDSGGLIKVEQSLDVPGYANQATVFLNGWQAKYLNSDHHIRDLATVVGRISLENGDLKWNAIGELADERPYDEFSWCYRYTALAWNDAVLNAVVDQDDADNFCKAGTGASDNFYFTDNDSSTTALSSFYSFIQNSNFPPGATVAVLPRGFGVVWVRNDYHLLQVAYNLDHSETFVERGRVYQKAFEIVTVPLATPASRVDSGFVSWQTDCILKDNNGRRDYGFGELVSALGGNDVGIIQPPFSILPKEDSNSPVIGIDPGLRTEDFAIENVPFEFAIPMLTGWDLAYDRDDEHVKEIGVWIDDWRYEKTPGASTGTLRYTLSSILKDRRDGPPHTIDHKVTILGLRPTSGETPIPID
ncbi:MAG: hypothetical protein ACRC2S_25810 [Waterburya sp.]